MLLLSVNNFTWKRNEDMELFISVYMTGGSTAEQRAPRYRTYGIKKELCTDPDHDVHVLPHFALI
jgi:hypothetical protein